MTFQDALHVEMAKIKPPITDAATKRAMIDALKKVTPTTVEREKFLKSQPVKSQNLFLAAEKDAKLVSVMPKDKKLSLGLGIGAGLMFFMGAPILLPLAAAGGAAWFFKKSRHSCMTPARQQVYEAALKDLKDPSKLKTLADEFEKEGCTKEANMLRKRAGLRELPAAQQKARRKVFKTAIKSTNVHGVESVAAAFEGEGANGAAEALRIHAAALKSL